MLRGFVRIVNKQLKFQVYRYDDMIENKEFQELLQKYPDDAVITIGVEYNGLIAFWDVEVKGIKFTVNEKDMKSIILLNKELSKEYEHLLNGGEIDG